MQTPLETTWAQNLTAKGEVNLMLPRAKGVFAHRYGPFLQVIRGHRHRDLEGRIWRHRSIYDDCCHPEVAWPAETPVMVWLRDELCANEAFSCE
jgi:hypothetical protein